MQTSCTSQTSKIWKVAEVRKIIDLHAVNEEKFTKQGCKKNIIWQSIAVEINKMGNYFTSLQCEQKWKNLTKAFRDTVDHNSKSGNEKKECPYFKELEESYGFRANVKPSYTLSSLSATKSGNTCTDTESATTESPDDSISDDQPKAKQAKKKESQNNSQVFQLLEKMREEMKQEQELITEMKQQHKDRMEKEEKKSDLMSHMISFMKR